MSVTAQTLHSALLKQIETIQFKKIRFLYTLFAPRLCSCAAVMKIYQNWVISNMQQSFEISKQLYCQNGKSFPYISHGCHLQNH